MAPSCSVTFHDKALYFGTSDGQIVFCEVFPRSDAREKDAEQSR
jgi:hypothetical protein